MSIQSLLNAENILNYAAKKTMGVDKEDVKKIVGTSNFKGIIFEFKNGILAALLFLLVAMVPIDQFAEKIFPYYSGKISSVIWKVIIIVVLFYVIENMSWFINL
jgi:hypothetical protein